MMIAGAKYSVKVLRRGPQAFRLTLGASSVDVVARKLNDGGLLVQVGFSGRVQRYTSFSGLKALSSSTTAACSSRWGHG